jgi:hypothetical protein
MRARLSYSIAAPARPMFAGIDQESWAMFAERERRWLFDAVEWLLKKRRPEMHHQPPELIVREAAPAS